LYAIQYFRWLFFLVVVETNYKKRGKGGEKRGGREGKEGKRRRGEKEEG